MFSAAWIPGQIYLDHFQLHQSAPAIVARGHHGRHPGRYAIFSFYPVLASGQYQLKDGRSLTPRDPA
jgi:hypothetical protein